MNMATMNQLAAFQQMMQSGAMQAGAMPAQTAVAVATTPGSSATIDSATATSSTNPPPATAPAIAVPGLANGQMVMDATQLQSFIQMALSNGVQKEGAVGRKWKAIRLTNYVEKVSYVARKARLEPLSSVARETTTSLVSGLGCGW